MNKHHPGYGFFDTLQGVTSEIGAAILLILVGGLIAYLVGGGRL